MFLQSRLGASISEPSTPVSQRKDCAQAQCIERNKGSQKPVEDFINRTPTSNTLRRTPRKTPISCCRTPDSKVKTPSRQTPSGDRLIPSRNNINVDVAHFKLVNEEPKESTTSPTKLEEEKQLKENLDPSSSKKKILSFKIKTPGSERSIFYAISFS